MMFIKEDYLQWFTSFFDKSLVEMVLLMNQIINLHMNFTSRLLESSREEKFIHPLEAVFGVLT